MANRNQGLRKGAFFVTGGCDMARGAKKNPRVSNGSRRRDIRRYWRAQGLPCAICHQPIDYELPAGHPWSFEVDEKVPVSLGGDPYSIDNTQPTHRRCNQQKSNSLPHELRSAKHLSIARSRIW